MVVSDKSLAIRQPLQLPEGEKLKGKLSWGRSEGEEREVKEEGENDEKHRDNPEEESVRGR